MESNIIKTIETHIDKLDAVDPIDLVQKKEKSSQLKYLQESDFIALYGDIIELFRLSIEKKYLFAISQYFVTRNGNNFTDILQILNQLVNTYLNPSRQLNLAAVEQNILECQNFLLQKGIYNLKQEVTPTFNIDEFNSYKSQSRRTSRLLNEKETRLEELNGAVSAKNLELNKLIKTQNEKIETIDNRLAVIDEKMDSIESLEAKAIESNSSVEVISESVSEIEKKFSTTYKGIEEKVDKRIEDLDLIIKVNNDRKDEVEKWIEDLSEVREGTESAYERLKELLDPAIAKNLLITFKKRKTTLFWAKVIWAIASIGAAWLLYHFSNEVYNKSLEQEIDLSKTIAAAIRLLPFLVLLYFCLRQFSKNRTLEEEYAFRESIATSLMSYAEQISDSSVARDELIRDTVGKLYTSPLSSLRRPLIKKEVESDKLVDKMTELFKEFKSSISNTGE